MDDSDSGEDGEEGAEDIFSSQQDGSQEQYGDEEETQVGKNSDYEEDWINCCFCFGNLQYCQKSISNL